MAITRQSPHLAADGPHRLAAASQASVPALLRGRLEPARGCVPLEARVVGAGSDEPWRIVSAARFMSRLTGLLCCRELACNAGLLFLDCPSVHCLGMRIPIDVIGLVEEPETLQPGGEADSGAVTMRAASVATAAPWSVPDMRGARHVLELAAGAAQGVKPGDMLVLRVDERAGTR